MRVYGSVYKIYYSDDILRKEGVVRNGRKVTTQPVHHHISQPFVNIFLSGPLLTEINPARDTRNIFSVETIQSQDSNGLQQGTYSSYRNHNDRI